MTEVCYRLDKESRFVLVPEPGHIIRVVKRNGKCIIDHEIDGAITTVVQLPLEEGEEQIGLTD